MAWTVASATWLCKNHYELWNSAVVNGERITAFSKSFVIISGNFVNTLNWLLSKK